VKDEANNTEPHLRELSLVILKAAKLAKHFS